MIISIILIAIISICIIIEKKYTYDDFTIITFILGIFSSIFLVMHIILISMSSFEYESLKTNRDSFEQTLNESRKNGNKIESAAIVSEIVDINIEIARYKYFNKTIFGVYIDDRIELLKPIK